jgi:cytochrome c oxidase subunit 2
MLVVFAVAVTVAGVSSGIQVPGAYARVDPNTVDIGDSPWANPQLRELAPGKYEVHILARMWSFIPGEIRIPAGSELTFYLTSRDVMHGMKITDTNINLMAIPGQVGKLTHTFQRPGEYLVICHEFCGALHHTMYGKIIVEEPAEIAQQQ